MIAKLLTAEFEVIVDMDEGVHGISTIQCLWEGPLRLIADGGSFTSHWVKMVWLEIMPSAVDRICCSY